jgi:hypothetical protein
LAPGHSARLAKIDAGGSLEARRLSSGQTMFYWRFTQDSRTERVPIGVYDPSAPPKALKPTSRGYSVVAATEAARDLARKNTDTPGGLRAERERERVAQEAAKQAASARERYTLAALCTDYCDWLKKQEKTSYRDVRNIFDNHLIAPFPALAAKPATVVEKREIVEAVRRLTESGKTTTARKLRSYLRAAFACAVKADSDAQLPSAFIGYNVATNPVESIAAIKGQKDKNPLPVAELRRYWKALLAEPGPIGAALRLHVVTGGQRVAQLVRLRDTELRDATLQLHDPKGKRSEPRPHLVPITDRIRAELDQLSAKGYILSTDAGQTPMHPTSMSMWASDVATRAGMHDFQLKRVRSGIETLLAEAGIPLHIRGQLQSHGLGGVQEGSYDAHTYLPEKRMALETLYELLERKEAKNVTPIRRKPRV